MAAEARRGQVDLPLDDFPVAGATVQPEMGAIQAIVGLTVVVEAPEDPAIRVVTQVAFRAQTAFVVVFGLMAADTLQGRIFVFLRQVAFFAGGRRMQSDEGEARKIMVEEDFGAPARHIVTVLALLPLLALMYIVLLMASKTRRPKLLLLWIRPPVAGPAGEFFVPLFQPETGVLVVVEGDLFPAGRPVTGGAFLANSSLMDVIFPMARVAGRG